MFDNYSLVLSIRSLGWSAGQRVQVKLSNLESQRYSMHVHVLLVCSIHVHVLLVCMNEGLCITSVHVYIYLL